MMSEKKTYYIGIANGEISQSSTSSPWNFKIEATDDEITDLREYFDQNHTTEWANFMRAHVPFVEYHNDRSNHVYDDNLMQVYRMIYQLGDEEARQHIKSMGILPTDTR
jgi:hypothetical protein